MEFFNKAKVVKSRSHLNKYLVADDDEQTVRQSRNGSARKARWTVEMVEGKSHVIRLKSCSSGKYLTPSSQPFLTGLTGKKVVQDIEANNRDTSIDWEPIKEGHSVTLRAQGGKLLRGNGGTPPWRNSVTHDLPNRTATQDWVLWDVEVVDIAVLESQESMADSLTSGVSSNRSPRVHTRQSGMEFFEREKVVRLQGFHNKYLVADDDEETVRQSHNASSDKARWTVEYVEKNPNVIRLKSCHGLYLSATNEAFLPGMTGKKVKQYAFHTAPEHATEWEPVRVDAFHIKLQTYDEKFLRANGGIPPWRNSITHDVPHRTATRDWVLWRVDVVDTSLSNVESVTSSLSNFSSAIDSYLGSPDIGSSRMSSVSSKNGSQSIVVSHSFNDKQQKKSSGMESFREVKSVRLRSHHDKYLLADSDGESVLQDRNETAKKAIWMVEFVNDFNNVFRLKSVYGKYLTATEDKVIVGFTGGKVVQSMPQKLDSSIEWEPIQDGFQVRLKTRSGNYLRANGGLPPWSNSITHDIPSIHHDWILWDVETVETRPEEPPSETIDPDLNPSEGSGLPEVAGAKNEGRIVFYMVADDAGNVDDGCEEASFLFKGHRLNDLILYLEEQTGIRDIIVCSRNPWNGKLVPLRLALPPNNKAMHVVVVPPTSEVSGSDFAHLDQSVGDNKDESS